MRQYLLSKSSSSSILAKTILLSAALAVCFVAACSDEETIGSGGAGGGGGTSSSTSATCTINSAPFEIGDVNGHAEPYGAKAASQARAGRLLRSDQIVQPAHGRQQIRVGDYVLANDKIAVVIEDKGLSDGYARFGGEVLSVDKVGEDGRPMGISYYGETLLGLSIEMVEPTSVTVLKDGSDGGDAVIRVLGITKPIPFMEGALGALFSNRFAMEMALDYILKPGAEKVVLRMSVVNRSGEAIDFGVNKLAKDEMFGFFHASRAQLVTDEQGYGEPKGQVEWVGFDAGESSFAFRTPDGKLEYGIAQSGFSLFWGPGFLSDACSITTHDHVEIVFGGPGLDGLQEAVRRSSNEEGWRSIKGVVKDSFGVPQADVFVHELGEGGTYLSRTKTASDGTYEIHAPPGKAVTLIPQKKGYPKHTGTEAGATITDLPLTFAPHGVINLAVKDETSGEPLPVRIQIIPKVAVAGTPAEWGVSDENNGRLHQEFAMDGIASLVVPPGEHHVVVSRGYEWEIFETDVTVAAGTPVDVTATLLRSVNTEGRMCADFHIHSFYSADSTDSLEYKVRGALADGLDLPVSSEHEWVADFQPILEKMGKQKWARGIPSEELTTFTWGHFGVVPVEPKDDQVNRGAIDWIGKKPAAFFMDVRAQAEKPALIVNHPRGISLASYFSAAQYDKDLGKGSDELWSDNFDAIEVFNDSDFEDNREKVVADWFSLLNHGYKVWAVGSSDSHHLRSSPVGYPRTCLFFGHDDPTKVTPSIVRDIVKSGDSTISGGLYMTVNGPSGEHPGQEVTVNADGEAVFVVTVESPGFVSGETIETIVNGKTVSIEALLPIGAGPSNKFMNQVTVTLDAAASRNWVVFHARGEGDLSPLHPGRKPFAVSNPVFLKK